MEKEQSAVSDFLKDIDNSESPFKEEESNPFENQEIETKKEVGQEEEKPLPFYKDPKVQKYIQKQIEKRMPKEEPREVTRETEDEFASVVDSFTAIIGNDTPEKVNALNSLQRALGNLDQRAANKATDALEAISQREAEADREEEADLEQAL